MAESFTVRRLLAVFGSWYVGFPPLVPTSGAANANRPRSKSTSDRNKPSSSPSRAALRQACADRSSESGDYRQSRDSDSASSGSRLVDRGDANLVAALWPPGDSTWLVALVTGEPTTRLLSVKRGPLGQAVGELLSLSYDVRVWTTSAGCRGRSGRPSGAAHETACPTVAGSRTVKAEPWP